MVGKKWAEKRVAKHRFLVGLVVFGGVQLLGAILVPLAAWAAPLKAADQPSMAVSYDAMTIFFDGPSLDGVSKGHITQTVSTDSPAGFATCVKVNTPTLGTCLKYNFNASTDCDNVPTNQKFSAVGAAGSGDAMVGANTWAVGRLVGPSTYNWLVPDTADSTLYSQATEAAGVETNIAAGIHPTKAQYSGAYSGTLTISTIANVPAAPAITAIYDTGTSTDASGSMDGGAVIDIVGTDLDTAYEVFLDLDRDGLMGMGEECRDADIVDAGQITCTVPPALSAGDVDVVVRTWGGSVTAVGGFEYTSSVPIVASVIPNTGHFRGGETVEIVGSGFTGVMEVAIGGRDCSSFIFNTDSSITCITQGISATYLDATMPTYVPGAINLAENFIKPNLLSASAIANNYNAVSVDVTTPNGTNATNALYAYRYQFGSYTDGGSYIYVLGEDIALGSKIKIGDHVCNNTIVLSSTTAVCTSTPPVAAGSYSVTIQFPPAPEYQFQPQSVSDELPTFDSAVCSSIEKPVNPNMDKSDWSNFDWTNYTKVVKDTRDGKSYRVRKMPDNRCWMIDNLALSTKTLISANDTDIDTDAGSDFVQKWNVLSNTNGRPVQETSTHSNGICTTHSSVAIADGGGYLTCDGEINYVDANDGYIAYSDPSLPSNPLYENCIGDNGVNSDSLTGCGYLYNWYTATAGSGRFDSSRTSAYDVASSICPAGWNLPKGNAVPAQNQFGILNNAMATGSSTSSSLVNAATTRPGWDARGAFEGSRAGSFGNVVGVTGGSIRYWSSSTSAGHNPFAYGLNYLLSSSLLYLAANANSYSIEGMALRCLL